MRLLPALVQRGERAIDIGANYGVYARALARLGATVELFEPHPRCLDALGAWARGRRSVRVHSCALSSEAGSATLAIPLGAGGIEHDAAASIEPIEGQECRRATVAVRTLDSFAFSGVGFIKIDVEGHEAQVIAGARTTIGASRPALLVEIEQRHCARPIADTFARLAALGYAGYFLLDGVLTGLARFRVEEHQPLGALGERGGYHNNFLFLARERLAAGDYRALTAG
jgi:FkbM family methyltransferase